MPRSTTPSSIEVSTYAVAGSIALIASASCCSSVAPVPEAHPFHQIRFHQHALVGERGVGGGDLERHQVGRSEGQAGVGGERRRDAAAAGEVDGPFRADQVHELHGSHVDGELERAAQRQQAVVAPVVVPRAVGRQAVGLPAVTSAETSRNFRAELLSASGSSGVAFEWVRADHQ